MPIPCFANQGCTVTLDADPTTGFLIASAHICQAQQLPAQGVEPIDAAAFPGTNVALQRQRYRMRRISADIAGGFMTADNISDSQPAANPFNCPAYGLLTYEFRVRGERNATAFTGQDCVAAGGVDADCADGETYDNAFYVRGYSQIDLNGLTNAQMLQPRSNAELPNPPPDQRTAIDEFGLWVPASKGIRDQAQASYNPQLSPLDATRFRDKIWQQTVLMRLDPLEAFTVDVQIQIDEKWHFDMSTGNDNINDPGSGRSGGQGAQLRGGTILYWPADDVAA